MKITLTLFTIIIPAFLLGQFITDFEDIVVADSSYIKDAGGSGYFESGDILLPNEYTDAGSYDFWNGWVISNLKDSISPGFTNEAAAFAGSGYNGSDNYAVTYVPSYVQIKLNENSRENPILGMYVCNSTYSALSMRDGDSFAKKFGGESGDDPDYLLLSIKKWYEGELHQDSVNFYLADYRFDDNSQDYIIKDWTWLDLSSLGRLDSLECRIYGSDIGAFGLNTPAYFCVDNITVEKSLATKSELDIEKINIYPNPAINSLCLDAKFDSRFQIFNSQGIKMKEGFLDSNCISIESLQAGQYYIKLKDHTLKFIKI